MELHPNQEASILHLQPKQTFCTFTLYVVLAVHALVPLKLATLVFISVELMEYIQQEVTDHANKFSYYIKFFWYRFDSYSRIM